jgi:hypothetical protein
MSCFSPRNSDFKSTIFPFLADSIEFVHGCAPDRWGLTPQTKEGFIRLNVAFTELLTIGANSIDLIVNVDSAKSVAEIKSGELQLLESERKSGDVLASAPGSRVVELQGGKNLPRYLAALRQAHHENIRVTVKRGGGIGRTIKVAHSNAAIQEIADEIGHQLPRPLYTYEEHPISPEEELSSGRMEGARKQTFSWRLERQSKNKEDAKKLHGFNCQVCGFNFANFYGEHGFEYIQVHHLRPLSELDGATPINPKTELGVVCANCHVMIHRDKMHTLSLDELKEMIAKQRDQKN